MARLLINASNLHGGGGLQVATSFFRDLSDMDVRFTRHQVTIVFSSALSDALEHVVSKLRIKGYRVIIADVHGFDLFRIFRLYSKCQPDLVFTVFGPFYWVTRAETIAGFAQPWIAYPDSPAYSLLNSTVTRFASRLKYFIQWWFFRRSDLLIVEMDHVRRALVRRGFDSKRVRVVPNAINTLLLERQTHSLKRPPDYSSVTFGYLTRSYAHKNIQFAIDVISKLNQIANKKFFLKLTLTKEELSNYDLGSSSYIINVGPQKTAEVPDFFRDVDAVFFPSLLECFSALPLESFFFKRTIFCSDYEFNKDLCCEHAIYVDVSSVEKAAFTILENIDSVFDDDRISAAREFCLSMPKSIDRSCQYVDIIETRLDALE